MMIETLEGRQFLSAAPAPSVAPVGGPKVALMATTAAVTYVQAPLNFRGFISSTNAAGVATAKFNWENNPAGPRANVVEIVIQQQIAGKMVQMAVVRVGIPATGTHFYTYVTGFQKGQVYSVVARAAKSVPGSYMQSGQTPIAVWLRP